MVDIVVNTTAQRQVLETVTVEKVKADLAVVDDRLNRLAFSLRFVDTDVVPEETVAVKLLVITGSSYTNYVSQNPLGSQTLLWNIGKLSEMVVQDVVDGTVPASDWKLIDVDFFEFLKTLSEFVN